MKRFSFISGTLAAILLLFVAVLAGCGGNDTASNGNNATPSEEKSAAGDKQKVDACSLVTQQDASKLMGKEAKKDESGNIVVDPAMLGECLWSYDYEMGSELIQFRVWGGEMYYAPTADSQSFDVGDKGSIRVNEFAGVDIEWLQDGKAYNLSYFTTGPDAPDAGAKVEDVKALARKVSNQV